MKHIYERGFIYVQLKDQGPDYLRERMKMYRERLKEEAEEQAKAAKVCGEIKPRVKGRV